MLVKSSSQIIWTSFGKRLVRLNPACFSQATLNARDFIPYTHWRLNLCQGHPFQKTHVRFVAMTRGLQTSVIFYPLFSWCEGGRSHGQWWTASLLFFPLGGIAKQTPWLAFPKRSKMLGFFSFFFLATSLAWVPIFCRNWVDLLHGLFCIIGPNPEKIFHLYSVLAWGRFLLKSVQQICSNCNSLSLANAVTPYLHVGNQEQIFFQNASRDIRN